jgi:HD-like signal output (HDOD) protein
MGAEYLTEIEAYGDFQPSMAFTAGLLHEIGMIVLSQYLTPQRRADIGSMMSEDRLSRIQAEKTVLGTNHAEVGACLLQRWGLPEVIVEAVAHHHAPLVKPNVRLSAVIYLADCAAHEALPSEEDSAACDADPVPEIAEMLDLELEEVEQMVAGVQGAMKSVNQFLTVA